MQLTAFFELVEGRTKWASVLPFLIGLLFSQIYFQQINWLNSAIFFVAMLLFDMMTAALSNLMDYRQAKDAQYQMHINVIGRRRLNVHWVARLVLVFFLIATLLGLWLVSRTHWLILLIGIVCCGVGIFYTFGPLPLSRLPLGEILAGLVMGLGIPFVTVYVNVVPANFVALALQWPTLSLTGSLPAVIAFGLTCVTPMATIANVILANNMSDLAEDAADQRMTLPMYLGPNWSIWVYRFLAYVGYAASLIAVVLKLLPNWTLLTLLTLPLAIRATNRFVQQPDKQTTFKFSLQGLLLENGGLLVSLLIGWGARVL